MYYSRIYTGLQEKSNAVEDDLHLIQLTVARAGRVYIGASCERVNKHS